jgi:hypothetical protein
VRQRDLHSYNLDGLREVGEVGVLGPNLGIVDKSGGGDPGVLDARFAFF